MEIYVDEDTKRVLVQWDPPRGPLMALSPDGSVDEQFSVPGRPVYTSPRQPDGSGPRVQMPAGSIPEPVTAS
jgi:hypothetical protein